MVSVSDAFVFDPKLQKCLSSGARPSHSKSHGFQAISITLEPAPWL